MINNNVCPFCKMKLGHYQEFIVLFRLKDTNEYEFSSKGLLYCENCRIPYINQEKMDEFQIENIEPYILQLQKSVYETRRLLSQLPPTRYEKAKKYIKYYDLGFRISDSKFDKTYKPTRIIFNELITKRCPYCNHVLKQDSIYIPMTKNQKATISGYCCIKHQDYQILFVHDKYRIKVKELISDNPYASFIKLDEKSEYDKGIIIKTKGLRFIEESRKRKQEILTNEEKLSKYPSSIMILYAEFDKGDIKEIIIVDDFQDENPKESVFWYNSDVGKEYLSAAFANQRYESGQINGKKYKIINTYFKGNTNGYDIYRIIPTYIVIKKDGGWKESQDCNNEVIRLLLYSPFTDRYEEIKATHNKLEDYCYTDIGNFRRFIRKFGNPKIGIELYADKEYSSYVSWDNLRVKSILMMYGYSVNQKDSLSDDYRRMILSEIIDLDILKASTICKYLEYFINSHPSDKDAIACDKWRADKEFVENYRYNPKRFLIASYK